MTETQKRLRDLQARKSTERQRMAEISLLESDKITPEIRSELDGIEAGTPDLERQLRAAQVGVDDENAEAEKRAKETKGTAVDPETRERLELRSRASLGTYLVAALRGRPVQGAEHELMEAAGVDGIPLELWDIPHPERRQAPEDRAITAAPGTVGLNLDTLQPEVFSPSIANRLMIDMPMVPSGTYATATVTAGADAAGAVAKSAEVPEVESTWTPASTTPHRVGAALRLAAEDIASVGAANFESLLRQHISLILSDELDNQILNGAAAGNDLTGIFERLDNPADPAAAVETWERFVAIQAGGIDGLWASMLSELSILAGPETYRLAARTVRAGNAADQTALEHMNRVGVPGQGVWTNKRMPAKAGNVQQGIICRKGRSMMPTPMRTAICPTWGYISIDDVYTGAGKGERRFVLSVLVGDVILTQPDAYQQIAFRVSV